MSKKMIYIILSVIVIAAGIVIISNINRTGEERSEASAAGKTTAEAVQNEAGDLIITKSDISENAVFYPVEAEDGTRLEVIAVEAADGSVRTAFNTCQVCYDSGRGYYIQEGNDFVCQNCGNRFAADDVEMVRGGCNPIPIGESEKNESENEIIIPGLFLEEAKDIFANWR